MQVFRPALPGEAGRQPGGEDDEQREMTAITTKSTGTPTALAAPTTSAFVPAADGQEYDKEHEKNRSADRRRKR